MDPITRKSHRLPILVALVSTLLTATSAEAQSTPPHTFSAGGGSAAGANFRISSTLGQPLAGRIGQSSPADQHRFDIGYWYLVVQRMIGSAAPPPLLMQNWLGQNVPNPFNPMTTISFTIAEPGAVRLRVYNLKGQRVADLVDGNLAAGQHSLVFRPTELPSGVYFYRLETGGFTQSKTLLLLK